MKKSLSISLRRATAIGAFAWLMMPCSASAEIAGNMSDAAIQGTLWGSMSINWVNYGNAASQVETASAPAESPAGVAATSENPGGSQLQDSKEPESKD